MRLAFALGLFMLAFVSAIPARADFAVIEFNSGYCRVWTGSGPLGVGCTASPLGKQPIWRCIARSPTIAAIIGGESHSPRLLSPLKARSPKDRGFSCKHKGALSVLPYVVLSPVLWIATGFQRQSLVRTI